MKLFRRGAVRLGIGYLTVFALAIGSRGVAAEKVSLQKAAVLMDQGEPSYVRYGVEDLSGYLKESTGEAPPALAWAKDHKGPWIVIGAAAAKQAAGLALSTDALGEEGYQLKTMMKDGAQLVIAAGATSRGTKVAIGALMKAIEFDGKAARLPADLDRTVVPPLAKRGMHFNGWPFNSPYSFRSWNEDQWKSYLDVLATQGVNLFYLWPFIEIIPVPLSPEDTEYLQECRRLVDYAHEKHGMEVWIMQCTNRVAKDNLGVADPRHRPYWRPATQQDLNPGNPEHFKAIMATREALYKIVNNVDGVCNIDSDPGVYAGSSLDEYVSVLNGCRALLDKHNVHGKKTKIINWMWEGWGLAETNVSVKDRDDLQKNTLEILKAKLPEPWEVIAGRDKNLPLCQSEGLLEKTVFLRYGAIEGEPAYPGTQLRIDELRHLFAGPVTKFPKMLGAMGNVQTPLLQFPNVYYFTSGMVDVEFRKHSQRETLLDLARHLYPEHQELVANCYAALIESDGAKAAELSSQLDALVQKDSLGRLGVFGRKLFPDHRIVAQSLVLQLNLRAARQRLLEATAANISPDDAKRLLTEYGDAYLAWDSAHGWHGLWGFKEWQLETLMAERGAVPMFGWIAKTLKDRDGVEACFAEVAASLKKKHDATAVDVGFIEPFSKAVIAARPIATLAQQATATASVTPDPNQYPASAAIDGQIGTRYWPGALVQNNTEWLQLAWAKPESFQTVAVRFLNHGSMYGRTIHLQREVAPGQWEDFATTQIPKDSKAQFANAIFKLPAPVTLDKIRIVNLLDLFEVEVR